MKTNMLSKRCNKIIGVFLAILLAASNCAYASVMKETMTKWEKVNDTFRTEIKKITTEKVTGLSQTYSFSSPVVSKSEGGRDIINIPEATLSFLPPNEPLMPFKSVNILIPYGFEVAEVEVIPGPATLLKGDYSIEPAPTLGPANGTPVPFSPDPRIYDSDNVYPFEPVGDVSVQNFKGFNIAVTSLYPLAYHPKSKKVYYYPDMQVKLNLVPGGEALPLSALHSTEAKFTEARENVSSLVDNPEVTDTYGK